MPTPTFSVFLDEDVMYQAPSPQPSTSSRKVTLIHGTPAPTTKENINPLTGLSFDVQPPLKKRKPSSSSALKLKPLASSSKLASKSKRFSSSGNAKDKGKKRAVLRTSENKIAALETETEQSRTALGNRRAYEFTVMPLANVTQAYDESEALRIVNRTALRAATDLQPTLGMTLEGVVEESDTEMRDWRDTTSKEATRTPPVITTGVTLTS